MDELKLAEMSLALERPSRPKVMCKVQRRSPKTGYVVDTCTMHRGHVDQDGRPNAHVDTHAGATWANALTPGNLAPAAAN